MFLVEITFSLPTYTSVVFLYVQNIGQFMDLAGQKEVDFVFVRGTQYWFTGLMAVVGGLEFLEVVMVGSLDHTWRYFYTCKCMVVLRL